MKITLLETPLQEKQISSLSRTQGQDWKPGTERWVLYFCPGKAGLGLTSGAHAPGLWTAQRMDISVDSDSAVSQDLRTRVSDRQNSLGVIR
jgi:hypothetical protein